MSGLSAADRYLLEQVQHGSEAAWGQLVDRFQGRLVAFATQQLSDTGDAEDVVQETFLSFIRSLKTFRAEASLETWLFGILRRRIVDVFRARGRDHTVRVCDLNSLATDSSATDFASSDPSVSWYARRAESETVEAAILATALNSVLGRLRDELRFQDLIVFELLFYAQSRNREISRLTGIDEKQVALRKHRFLKRLSEIARSDDSSPGTEPVSAELLTKIWERLRPSCPKRSTLGRFLLGTLDDGWNAYIAFHTNELGCRFCNANLDDLESTADHQDNSALSSRIFQSTIGFLS